MAGDVGGKDGVGSGRAVAGRDGDKPARAGDERGHFSGGGVEVAAWAARVFDGVGEAAGLGFGLRERAVARVRVFTAARIFMGKS